MTFFMQFFTVFLSLVSVALCGLSNEEMQSLRKAQGNSGIIPLTDSNYQKILDGPRDFHLVLFLTSSAPQFRCVLCAEVKPAYEIIARSWLADHADGLGNEEGKDIFFLTSEFTNSKTLFAKLGLESIPKMYQLPPSENDVADSWLKETSEYLFFQGDHKELITGWLKSTTGHEITLRIPFDYSRIALNAATTLAVAVIVKIFSDKIKAVLTSKLTWSGLSTVAILLLTTGYMFNQIRSVPYVLERKDGSVTYIIGEQQNQLAVETQIVSFVYGFLSLLFVVLIKRVPELKNPQVKLIAAGLVSGVLFLIFSVLLSIFHVKNPMFPFHFLRFNI